MPGQYEVLSCPFCDKGKIQCLYFPSAYKIRHIKSGKGGRSNISRRSAENWLIQSGCSVCGKTSQEVEKELKNKNII